MIPENLEPISGQKGAESIHDRLEKALLDTAKPELSFEYDGSRARRFGFQVNQHRFLVKQGLYCELIVDPLVTPLPNSADHVMGLINIRGNIVTLYSLSVFLGGQKSRSPYAYLIGEAQSGAALVVDKIPTLVDLTDIKSESTNGLYLQNGLDRFVDAVFRLEDRLWLSLNHDDLFRRFAAPL